MYNSRTVCPVLVNATKEVFQIHIINSIHLAVTAHCPLAHGDDAVEMFK